MATNIYMVNSQNSVALIFADEAEVEAMIESQNKNPFLKEERRIEYILLGNTVENISIEFDKVDTFSVSKLASCNDVDFHFLQDLELDTLSVQNTDFLLNKTLPDSINSKKLVIGCLVESHFNLDPFSNIESMEILSWSDKTMFEGVSNTKSLTVWGVNTKKSPVLSFAPSFPKLESLTINKSNAINLSGISLLRELRCLSVSYAPRLANIGDLEDLDRLEMVSFEKCGRIFDFTCLANLNRLMEIKVLDCKEIKTVEFIKNLPCLKTFTLLKTKVLDDSENLISLIEG
ncbi:hypothetical protein LRP50_25135 [Enterovibrio sp. ZSDZ42]|uniref:Internalin n=1 Tax=Enterovibrio gelatinilyticus TaxID=2899819 RepID=A0ABT5R9A1_9GAMM|nr:hypothetical protein [Enterovibrio sp. ZSDZ42]MDD1796405.1 hypothetical protein [Enterovibrio sp. ZSDZ42]